MRLSRLLGAALGTGFLFLAFSSGANAYDHWDREHDRDHWRSEQWRHEHHYYAPERPVVVHERPVVVRERPVVVERAPVVVPAPMYAAPMYQAPAPSGLNLNFNIPLN
jgi:hypothetical protein